MSTPQGSLAQAPSVALLIDGDNAQSKLFGPMLAETARYGSITVRRIYGDWTSPQMTSWKSLLHAHAVQPVQQFRYTTGKNATDSALIIDAMDLLHSGMVSGFCIASSDSDYTRLATRIREHGLFVIGVGRKQTPKSFVNACDVFVYTENLADEASPSTAEPEASKEASWVGTAKKAVETACQDDGWAPLSAVGSYIRKLDPAFDPRSFGHKQLSLLVKSRNDLFATKDSKSAEGPSGIYVKLAG